MEEKEIFQEAIDTYGASSQIDKTIEELSELIQALCHIKEGRSGSKQAVEEEIADVEIMIDQLKMIFDNDKIFANRVCKVKRLKERIDARR